MTKRRGIKICALLLVICIMAVSSIMLTACDSDEELTISLNVNSLTLTMGKTTTLVATVTPEGAEKRTVTWSSDNESVVAVSDAGYVTTIAPGNATITATVADKTATCAVTVVPEKNKVWNGSVDKTWYTADAETTEYRLTSAEELAGLAELVNNDSDFSGKTIVLDKDINLGGKEWTPIGQKGAKKHFNGTFDGNGKSIVGLSIQVDREEEKTFDGYVSLFGATENATIKNITVSGNVIGKNAAGIVARANAGTVIENCISNVIVESTGKAGGIVCLTNTGAVTITDCINNGTVTNGTAGVGGIVGYTNAGTMIEGCTNNGVISTNSNYAGGIAGYVTGDKTDISKCENKGAISASGTDTSKISNGAGGIVGIVTGVAIISENINSGTIKGMDKASAGGIVGSFANGQILDSKNTAPVHGHFAGGVVGVVSTGEIINCSGGTAEITSPAFILSFNGHEGTVDIKSNETAGRILGANGGSAQDKWTKITIDDDNGDSYEGIGTVGLCGPFTTWANLEIVSGTMYGNPIAGNKTYIKLNEGAIWGDRELGTYICGGVNVNAEHRVWTKQ